MTQTSIDREKIGIDLNVLKQCALCKKMLPRRDFRYRARSKDRCDYRCKACEKLQAINRVCSVK